MSRGGKRVGSGRKKVGYLISMRIDKNILFQIDKNINGSSKAEKIRKCIEEGLKSFDMMEDNK